ncbi:MAG: sigma-54 interaction domain-containing protein [Gemmatimonadaceae bacterium]
MLSLSDSFSSMWPALASECGLALSVVPERAAIDRLGAAVGVITAGGAEEQLEPAFREWVGDRLEIAAVGALPSHRLASSVMRAGAAVYFALPGDYDLLRSWLQERAEQLLARHHNGTSAAVEAPKYRFEGILGESETLRAALERVARIIPHSSVTVLLTGETGTGKELVARAIHYNGPRCEAPFVDVNCAAIPDQLLESELFGHEKGAFTDATVSKPGLFELANGGTLLLDEVGHLPLALQGKLLRALEERAIRRVGGTQLIPIDVRMIAATHVDLAAAVRRGEFREDLFHRLNVVPIALPPLRARREDIPGLARHFLARVAGQYGLAQPALSADAEQALASREWTGNVRELRNLMERTLLLSPKETLRAEDFAEDDDLRPGGSGRIPFPATLAEITRTAAAAMLEHCGGNKSKAARRLAISRSRLQRILDSTADTDSDLSDDGEADHD